jgi:hypothetical protein
MTTARLGDIATARGGDKGDTCNICVFVTKETDYQAVRAQLTAERVAAAYPRLFRGPVKRYAVDHLMVLNFVIANGLEGGVNASLNLDTHGKSFSYLLLDLEIDLQGDGYAANNSPSFVEETEDASMGSR